jgi:zinc D-Ala-D-Ala carboxypeptidase
MRRMKRPHGPRPPAGYKLPLFGLAALLIIFSVIKLSPQPKLFNSATNANFNTKQYSLNKADSLWVIVNKGRVLPNDYQPFNLITPNVSLRLSATDPEMKLRSEAARALEAMFADANAHNLKLMLGSGYRSYGEQVKVYGGNVKAQGSSIADQSSARPGYSEHQTGLAVDVEPIDRSCEFSDCFADTSEGIWLGLNSYRYGFILRYPKNSQALTGYQYEPWHIRFVGRDLAAQIYQKHQTLEQFFSLPINQNYSSRPLQLQ